MIHFPFAPLISAVEVLHEGAKYGMSQAGGTFTLAIRDPNPLDTGRYK